MRVLELWRHPVKSFQGERLDTAVLETSGLAGDREWGVLDTATGRVLTGRREPRLLLASARRDGSGEPVLVLPDGRTLVGPGPATDAALSAWLGRDVTLAAAADRPASDAEFFTDPVDDSSATGAWTMPAGRFVDALPLLLLTTAALRAGAATHPGGVWDVRRFRPNLLIEAEGTGWPEDGWCGSAVRIGATVVTPVAPCARCTMVTRPQPGLERDLDVYLSLKRAHAATFGVWAQVERTGTVQVGDPVEPRG